MNAVSDLLEENGVCLLHCITAQQECEGNQWIKNTYSLVDISHL